MAPKRFKVGKFVSIRIIGVGVNCRIEIDPKIRASLKYYHQIY